MLIGFFQSVFNLSTVAGLLAAITLMTPSGLVTRVNPADAPDAAQADTSLSMAAVFEGPAGFAATNDTVYPLGALNLRSGPSTASDVLTVLPANAPVRRLAVGDCGWSLVRYLELEGYCSTGLLTNTQPAKIEVTVPAAQPAPTQPAPAQLSSPAASVPAAPAPAPTPVPTPVPTAAPTTAPTTAPAPQTSGYLNAAYGAELMRLINNYRVSNGLNVLAVCPTKQAGTDYAARQISVYFAHTGYENNIAAGFGTPQACLNAWISSPGHNTNLLWASATTGSVSCFVDYRGVTYWAFKN